MALNDEQRGVLLSVSGALWAAAYLIPYKAAAAWVSADVLALAMLLSAAVFSSVATLIGVRARPLAIDRLSVAVSVALGALAVLGNIAMAEALVSLDPGVASVLLRTQVLFVGLMGWWFLGERVTLRFAIGALLALVGLGMLKTLSTEATSLSTAGISWALLGALAFAIMQVIIRKVIHRIRPVEVNALRLWIAVALLACLSWRSPGLGQLGLRGWLLAVAAALCGPFLSRIFLMWSVRHIPAALSTLVALVGPVFAFVFGILAFGAWPSARELIGGGIMLVGIAVPVVEAIRNDRHSPSAPPG